MRIANPAESCLAPYLTRYSGKSAAAPYSDPRSRTGFTLIELLAVLVIIVILMAVFVPKLLKAREVAEESATRAFMGQLETALAEYDNRFGDWPPSQFVEKWGSPPNSSNLGAEALFLSLWSPDWESPGLPEDRLVNGDGDETRKAFSRLPKATLFELRDDWRNPIAYFHHRDYGRQDAYLTRSPATGEEIESNATARRNPATGSWYNPTKFQLLSAGLDGEFGTEDDIGNWQKPKD